MSAEKTLPQSKPGLGNESFKLEPGERRSIDINGKRLWERLGQLGEIGAFDDTRTGERGVCRLALTDAEIEGRNLVEKWMRDAGLSVEHDAIGNVYARREGRRPQLPAVMIGSHIDTVGTAGRFDGCLGVLGGLEVVERLDEENIETERSIIVAYFTDEEGVRFGTDMLGSATAVGRLDLQWALGRRDRDGVSVEEELKRHNATGHASLLTQAPPHSYLECHIEQGPILLEEGKQLGVVTGVQGISWWRIVIGGSAAHAGCTPMGLRRDAGLALALLRAGMWELTKQIPGLLCNFGYLSTTPGLVNVIPDTASATIDLRNPDEDKLVDAENTMRELIAAILKETGCELLDLEQTARTQPISFHKAIVDAVEDEIAERGIETMRIVSGAGHDAQEVASIAPAGMIFVRGQNEGVSHSPREYSTLEDCAAGVSVLATLTLKLANQV